jgi:hypothetical protein
VALICALQEIGQTDGIDVPVTEYLEGQNPAQVLVPWWISI